MTFFMNEDVRLKRGRVALAAGASLIAIGASGAYAQGTVDQIEERDQLEGIDTQETDEIVVTGSRIRRSNFDEIYPSTVVSSEYIEDRAFTNLSDALTEIPAFGGGISSAGDQAAANVGQSFVDFLDLGTARTLVLVDGRRFVSSTTASLGGATGTQVDLNAIPTALIDRTEIIGIGGAPVYGSDAIAGTVNVILRDDFEGLETTIRYGATTDYGDADLWSGQVVAGANILDGRGNVTFTLQYEERDGLLQTDRDNIYAPRNDFFFSQFDAGNGDDLPAQRALYNNSFINIFTNGGVASPGSVFIGSSGAGSFPGGLLQFNEQGELIPFNAGIAIPGQSAFFARGGDGANLFQEVGSLITPSERLTTVSRFKYDVTENIEAFADLTFANTVATELVNQGGFQSFAFGGTSGALEIGIDNPLLTSQARQTLIANGVEDGVDTNGDGDISDTFFINRFNNDIIDPADSLETHLWRFSGGFRGEFEALGREVFWDASYTHGESDLEVLGDFIIDGAFLNAVDVTRVTQEDIDAAGGIANINAISGVTVGLGDIVCQSVLDAAAGDLTGVSGSGVTDADLPFTQGCAPLDIFGDGRASQAALDFVTGASVILNDNTSSQMVFNLASTLFELPAGPVQFNVGFENRYESGQFTPAAADQVALGRSTASLPNGGSYRTDEFYGEAVVPVVSPDMNIPLVDMLSLEGSYRYIDPNTFDTAESFSLGGRYRPFEDLIIRGNYTEAFRLPSVAELFTPLSGTFSFADDPCDNRFIGEAADVALRTANCQADGIEDPTTFASNIVNATALGATGGNDALNPEKSESWTVGAEWTPAFLDDFSLSVDYYAVKILDAIVGVSLTQILNACYDSPNFPNDPNCDAFVRDGDRQIVDFQTGQANAGLFDTEFLQVQARYAWEVSDGLSLVGLDGSGADRGRLSHSINVFSPQKRDFAVGDENPGLNATLGNYTDPNVELNFTSRYELGNFGAFWGILWQDNPSVTANPLNNDEYIPVPGPLPQAGFAPAQLGEDGRFPSDLAITKGDGSQFIHNASVSYNFEEFFGGGDALMQLTVNNVFDREPSVLERALADFNQTQIVGRYYTLTFKAAF